jgi:hypothetical protein
LRQFFSSFQNDRFDDTCLGWSLSTLPMLRTFARELPKLKDCIDDIVKAAKIKMLAPQKLTKDCLSDVGFAPLLTKHKVMLNRFKRTLDRLLPLDGDLPEKASKVAC